MINLVPIENRKQELLNFGFPKAFIDNIGNIAELRSRVENVDGAYFYLPQISNYKILKDQTVIPIFDSGERFCVLIGNDEVKRIICFELENDEIYNDYGENWRMLLMDIMIQYFDDQIDNDISMERFVSVGEKIGFQESRQLFNLRNLPIDVYNAKFEDQDTWRLEISKELKIQSS